jgi:hypothetical protein
MMPKRTKIEHILYVLSVVLLLLLEVLTATASAKTIGNIDSDTPHDIPQSPLARRNKSNLDRSIVMAYRESVMALTPIKDANINKRNRLHLLYDDISKRLVTHRINADDSI